MGKVCKGAVVPAMFAVAATGAIGGVAFGLFKAVTHRHSSGKKDAEDTSQVRTLKKQLSIAQENNSTLTSHVSSLSDNVQELQVDQQRLFQRDEALQAQVRAKNRRLEEMQRTVIQIGGIARRVDADKKSALDRSDYLSDRVNHLNDRHRQQAAHLASLTQQLQQSHSREQNLVAQGATKDAELLRRAQEIAAKDAELLLTANDVTTKNAELLQRAHAITAKDWQIQALQAQVQALQNQTAPVHLKLKVVEQATPLRDPKAEGFPVSAVKLTDHFLQQGSSLYREVQGIPEGPMDSPHTPTLSQPGPRQTTFFTSGRLNRRQADTHIEEVVEPEESQAAVAGEEDEAESDAAEGEKSEVAASEEEEEGELYDMGCLTDYGPSVLPERPVLGQPLLMGEVWVKQLASDFWHYKSLTCLTAVGLPWERYWALVPADLQSALPNCQLYKLKLDTLSQAGAGQAGSVNYYEMWEGKRLPPTYQQGYATGFKAVAVKTVADDLMGAAEAKALAAVRDKLQGMQGPQHVTFLIEAICTMDADSNQQLNLVTPFAEGFGLAEAFGRLRSCMEEASSSAAAATARNNLLKAAAEAVRQMLKAVAVLHSIGMIHADMKGNKIRVNMLRDGSQLHLPLLDLSRCAEEGRSCSLVVGDLAYTAPEVLGTFVNPRESKVTPAADIWGIACIFFEILTGSPLFGAAVNEHCEGDRDKQGVCSGADGHAEILPDATDSDFEICPVTLLVQSQQRLLAQNRTSTACEALQTVRDILEECTHREHVVDLLRGMLHEDPAERLTMNQILAHRFFML